MVCASHIVAPLWRKLWLWAQWSLVTHPRRQDSFHGCFEDKDSCAGEMLSAASACHGLLVPGKGALAKVSRCQIWAGKWQSREHSLADVVAVCRRWIFHVIKAHSIHAQRCLSPWTGLKFATLPLPVFYQKKKTTSQLPATVVSADPITGCLVLDTGLQCRSRALFLQCNYTV